MKNILLSLSLSTPYKGGWGVPTLLWGPPGTGKSSAIQALERDDFPIVTLIGSIHDPTDFSGLPFKEEGWAQYAHPAWAKTLTEAGQGILFLDELTTAPPAVQAAMLRLVLEKAVGQLVLPPKVRVIAAANPPELAAGGWELAPPLANRFLHLRWELTAEEFVQAKLTGEFPKVEIYPVDPVAHAARVRHWDLLVAGFLKKSPAMLFTSPEEGEYAYATPRSWDMAVALMATADLVGADMNIRAEILRGVIGAGVAMNFLAFVRENRIPDPDAVLRGEPFSVADLREDEQFAFAQALLAKANIENPQHLKILANVMLALQNDAGFLILQKVIREQAFAELIEADAELREALNNKFESLINLLDE